MLTHFKDDNPKNTKNTDFQAGSDNTPMAIFKASKATTATWEI